MASIEDIDSAPVLRFNTQDGDTKIQIPLDIEEDVEAELDIFVGLVCDGALSRAHDYFDKVLKEHLHVLPVLMEYVDLLLEEEDYRQLEKLEINSKTVKYDGWEPTRELTDWLSKLQLVLTPTPRLSDRFHEATKLTAQIEWAVDRMIDMQEWTVHPVTDVGVERTIQIHCIEIAFILRLQLSHRLEKLNPQLYSQISDRLLNSRSIIKDLTDTSLMMLDEHKYREARRFFVLCYRVVTEVQAHELHNLFLEKLDGHEECYALQEAKAAEQQLFQRCLRECGVQDEDLLALGVKAGDTLAVRKWMIKHGTSTSAKWIDCIDTALDIAIQSKNYLVVEELLRFAREEYLKTVVEVTTSRAYKLPRMKYLDILARAIASEDYQLVALLLESGAQPTWEILYDISKRGDEKMIALLLPGMKRVDIVTAEYDEIWDNVPLETKETRERKIAASMATNPKTESSIPDRLYNSRYLHDADDNDENLDPQQPSRIGKFAANVMIAGEHIDELAETPLEIASLKGHTQVVKLFMDYLPDFSSNKPRSPEGFAPRRALVFAASAGHVDIANLLVRNGISLSRRDGLTLVAMMAKRTSVIRLLLSPLTDIKGTSARVYVPSFLAMVFIFIFCSLQCFYWVVFRVLPFIIAKIASRYNGQSVLVERV